MFKSLSRIVLVSFALMTSCVSDPPEIAHNATPCLFPQPLDPIARDFSFFRDGGAD